MIQVSINETLRKIIKKRIQKHGPNCNMNMLDISLIKDMYGVFYKSQFNGDISEWDVSNVENMNGMFYQSKFTGDISKWNFNKAVNKDNLYKECSHV